ncbi:hypothetical protein EVAR_45836_1 [Eumeta japonica]|uniref:Uncharacterized protein n=1 Tax=Eumeta variegata TaxID=151549 RepID=A0A4C1WPF3_EUMVA|nr:hypothetical protein EVAR_45836_1 [Eumeta japonica]
MPRECAERRCGLSLDAVVSWSREPRTSVPDLFSRFPLSVLSLGESFAEEYISRPQPLQGGGGGRPHPPTARFDSLTLPFGLCDSFRKFLNFRAEAASCRLRAVRRASVDCLTSTERTLGQ